MTETGSGSSRLKLDSNTFNSLRSSIGVNSNWSLPLSSGAVITTDLQLAWNHELLNTDLMQNVSFANYQKVGSSSKNQVAGRDSLDLKAGMRYQINKNIELGAGVTSRYTVLAVIRYQEIYQLPGASNIRADCEVSLITL
ncbi:autotransporter outer membrane beta-barrel domain-containing protein [Xenorhabdus japonica]|uniref:Outer membrane autotransporter barrel domain-containing protein n=1 Tax=Xenorhabdus japonica TaxID=53341 RepID=A0A1I5CQM9_9GAMM|nr:autotransporter outer membrane beta-barrel domain-containing protein [Xenorhabdus japonica]SFN89166.1 outer membrane autotransporter barrel domain-containing protein [Xenorhabdus japonica]